MGGIVANAAKRETEALAVNARVRFVVYATPEERNGPTAFPRNLAEFRIPIVNPLLESFFPPSPSRTAGPAE